MDVQFLEIFSENQLGQQEAWIWFLIIPILILLGIITYHCLKGDKMAILGMQESGKTTILRYMQGLTYDSTYKPSGTDPYKSFDWKVGDRTIEAGVDIVKVFPGSAYGPDFIKAIKGPLPQANIMPTGGVSLDNVDCWIKNGCVGVGVGSDLTAPAKHGDYAGVTELAKQFIQKVAEARK